MPLEGPYDQAVQSHPNSGGVYHGHNLTHGFSTRLR